MIPRRGKLSLFALVGVVVVEPEEPEEVPDVVPVVVPPLEPDRDNLKKKSAMPISIAVEFAAVGQPAGARPNQILFSRSYNA